MTRRSRNRSRKGGGKGKRQGTKQGSIVEIPFALMTNISVTSAGYSSGVLAMNTANMGPRILAVRAQYELFRIKNMRLKILPSIAGTAEATVSPIGVTMAIAYTPCDLLSAPASFTDMFSLPVHGATNGYVPLSVVVPPKVLNQREYKWYKSLADSGAPTDASTHGQVWYMVFLDSAIADNCSFWCMVEGVCQLSAQSDGAISAPDGVVRLSAVQGKPNMVPVHVESLEEHSPYLGVDVGDEKSCDFHTNGAVTLSTQKRRSQ